MRMMGPVLQVLMKAGLLRLKTARVRRTAASRAVMLPVIMQRELLPQTGQPARTGPAPAAGAAGILALDRQMDYKDRMGPRRQLAVLR